jgi:hypothetical protein
MADTDMDTGTGNGERLRTRLLNEATICHERAKAVVTAAEQAPEADAKASLLAYAEELEKDALAFEARATIFGAISLAMKA